MKKKDQSGANQRKTPGYVIFMALISIILIPGYGLSDDIPIDPKVEKAILVQNWSEVIELLGPDDKLDADPVARLIKAHACLAINRNNESLCLFLSVTTAEELKKWQSWTERFVSKHPKKPVSHYFAGDALSRLEKWDGAFDHFDKGLDLDSDNALILTARGVTWASKGDWDSSLTDITRATRVSAPPADAYASLGAYFIKWKEGAEGAKEYFDKALELSPEFALALNGRGCARFALGDWDAALDDFRTADTLIDCLPIAFLNAYALTVADLNCVLPAEDSLTDEDAKMSLQRLQTTGQIALQNVGIMGNIAAQAFYGTLNSMNLGGSATAGWSTRGPQASITASANPNWTQLYNSVTSMTNQSMVNQYSTLHNLHTQYHSLPPGGVLIDMRKKYVDKGNWLETWPGLFYHFQSRDRGDLE